MVFGILLRESMESESMGIQLPLDLCWVGIYGVSSSELPDYPVDFSRNLVTKPSPDNCLLVKGVDPIKKRSREVTRLTS